MRVRRQIRTSNGLLRRESRPQKASRGGNQDLENKWTPRRESGPQRQRHLEKEIWTQGHEMSTSKKGVSSLKGMSAMQKDLHRGTYIRDIGSFRKREGMHNTARGARDVCPPHGA